MKFEIVIFSILTCFFSSFTLASAWGLPDSDSFTLASILSNNIAQNAHLTEMLSNMSTAMEYASDTTKAVRAASDVVRWASYPSELGNDLLEDSIRKFDQMYPDANKSRRYVELIKRDINQTGTGGYNYYALRDAVRSGKKLEANMTDINARLADKDKVSDAHDEFSKELRGNRIDVDKLYGELESAYSSNKLTPQEAAVFHARISALQARALTQMAANQNESSRLDKVRFNNEMESSLRAKESFNRESKAMEEAIPKSLSLDPWNYNPNARR